MNPNLCRIVLRPRDPLETFDLALRFVHARPGPLLRVGVAVIAPPWLFLTLLCWWTEGAWWPLLLALAVTPWLQAPFTLLCGRLLFAETVPLSELAGELLRRTPALVGAWGLFFAGLAIGALPCGLGVPVAQGWLLFLTEAAVLERVPLQRGLRRSLRLANGALPSALFGAAAWWGLSLWFALLGEAAGQSVVGVVLQLGAPFGLLQEGHLTPFLLLGLFAAQPLFALLRLLLYVDVRTRLEGWDIQVALRAAGLESA